MENQELTTLQNKHTESLTMDCNWSQDDTSDIAKKYAFLLTVQRTYGQDIDIATTLKGWRFILKDYTPNQILNAMDKWVRQSPAMPTPSDIIKTIESKTLIEKEIERSNNGGFIC